MVRTWGSLDQPSPPLAETEVCDGAIPSSSSTPSITLPNGVSMPLLGLGTTHSGGYNHESVLFALSQCGYRMVDTAKRYGVEAELGRAFHEASVPREELFIASKLWPVDFGSGVSDACKGSCQRLQTDYLDLYLIHFPEVPRWFSDTKKIKEETWRQMELLYDREVVRSLGVSNYSVENLEELLEFCSVPPHVNQCEFHPCFDPIHVRHFCESNDIQFTGYCPLAKGKILKEEAIEGVAARHNKTPAQICIRWSIEHGIPAIPKSRDTSRVFANSQVFDFSLDQMDYQELRALAKKEVKVVPLENLQEKFSLPDGYKLHATQ